MNERSLKDGGLTSYECRMQLKYWRYFRPVFSLLNILPMASIW
jgi:hypothetical protein